MTKFLAWDIEISKVLPEDVTDWQAHMPLGISCMATHILESERTMLWYGGERSDPQAAMSIDDLIAFIHYLHSMIADGYTILTWNGLSFDWHQLAFESGLHAECVNLAMNHVDMMLQVLCIKGFPLGLDAVAKGMGLAGKTEGMDGAKAPQMWAAGEYDTVLSYVQQDVRTTLEVALAVERTGYLHWIARSGKSNAMRVERWLTVRESLALPLPDTGWMTSPLPRSKFTEWMQANQPT